MRALWPVVVIAVVLSGCPFNGIPCSPETAAETCGVGNSCSDGFCVQGSGGGATGGGSTGGGGMTGGGGSTGGGTGGSTGGGTGGGGGGADLCTNVNCPIGYSCTAGMCFLRVTGIVVDAPTDNLVTNQTLLTVRAHFTTDASVTLPDTMELVLDNGTPAPMMGISNAYASMPSNVSAQNHLVRVRAAFADAGLSSPDVHFEVDTEGPRVSAVTSIEALDVRRDDVAVVGFNSNEPLRPGTRVTLGGVEMNRELVACPTGDAGCWTLDMSQPSLEGLEGDFTVLVDATDRASNMTTSDAGTVRVTRKRWEVRLNSDEIRTAPAIGADGTLFIGTRSGTSTGTLFAVNPTDGGAAQAPSNVLGAIVSLATATSVDAGLLFYTANSSSGFVGARRQDNIAASASVAASNGNSGSTYSAIGLVAGANDEVGAVAAFNNSASPGVGVAYWPSTGVRATNAASPPTAFDFSTSTNEPANNIVVNGSTAYLLTRPGGAGLYRRSITGLSPGNNPADGAPQTIAGSGTGALTTGQSFVNSESVVGGMISLQSFYRVSGMPLISGNLTAPADNGMVAFDGTRAFAGRGDALVAFDLSTLSDTMSATPLASVMALGGIRMSPVLGDKRPGESVGQGYAVASDGVLYVFGLNANSARDWKSVFSMAATGTVTAHPTLDCNRRPGAATTRTGVLYVTNSSGWVAAIIVDSPRLLTTTGAWPKYQRTAGNAGNPDARFQPNPGCPPP